MHASFVPESETLRISTPIRAGAFLGAFAICTLILGIAIVYWNGPDQSLVVAAIPVVYVGAYHPRWIYLSAFGILISISVGVTWFVAIRFSESLQTITVFAGALLAITETLRAVIGARLRAEEQLHRLAATMATVAGEEFFRVAVVQLAELLDVSYVFIGELDSDKNKVRTLAFWSKDRLDESFTYELANTPCEEVVGKRACYHPKHVQLRYPKDMELQSLGIQRYLGVPFYGSSGTPLGLVVVMDEKPEATAWGAQSMVEIIAARAGIELERLYAAAALKESEERFRVIAEQSVVGINILSRKGSCFANDACAQVTGYSKDEIVNWTFENFMEHVHPDDRAYVVSQAAAKLQGASDAIREYEFRILDPEGNIRHLSLYSKSIRFDNQPAILAVLINVTDRVAAEAARRAALSRFEALFEHTPMVAIQGFDRNGVVRHWNSASETVYGFKAIEAVGKRLQDLLLSGDDVRVFEETVAQVWDTARAIEPTEYRVRTRNGGERWVYSTMFPVVSDGIVDEVFCMDVDITARKKAEEDRLAIEAQVQHVQKLESLGVLAGGIAHDFNNLLVGILGNADLALMDLSQDSPVRDNIVQVETAAKRAAELARQMLAYSGKGRFVVQPLSLTRLVEEIAHLLEVSISKKAVLKYNFSSDLPLIEGDATQIRQVIMNLITNASDAVGEKSGYISIATGVMECDQDYLADTYIDEKLPKGEYAYLEVSDTGSGMDRETQSKIFDPFFTTKFTGRGLGLAAVLGIVRGHKGALKVYSEPGRGSMFKVLFPVIPCCETPEEAEFAQSSSPKGSGTILVVDDEETVRAFAVQALKKLGYDVLVAFDGLEGTNLYRERWRDIDLVLLDMTMPHMNGEEAFEQMQRINPDARIVLSSGYNEQEATKRFLGKGLSGFVQKPYQISELSAKLRAALDR